MVTLRAKTRARRCAARIAAARLEKIKSLRRLEMRLDGGRLGGLLELVKALPKLEYLRCWPGIPHKDAIAAACPKLELDGSRQA